jgi:hypothetical protein
LLVTKHWEWLNDTQTSKRLMEGSLDILRSLGL